MINIFTASEAKQRTKECAVLRATIAKSNIENNPEFAATFNKILNKVNKAIQEGKYSTKINLNDMSHGFKNIENLWHKFGAAQDVIGLLQDLGFRIVAVENSRGQESPYTYMLHWD